MLIGFCSSLVLAGTWLDDCWVSSSLICCVVDPVGDRIVSLGVITHGCWQMFVVEPGGTEIVQIQEFRVACPSLLLGFIVKLFASAERGGEG